MDENTPDVQRHGVFWRAASIKGKGFNIAYRTAALISVMMISGVFDFMA